MKKNKLTKLSLIIVVLVAITGTIFLSNKKINTVKSVSITKKEYRDKHYSVETYRQALLETAHAYFRKGVYAQYDSYRLDYHASPEDATSQNYIYSVCSGFTYQTYYQTFGIRIPRSEFDILNYGKDIYEKYGSGKNVIYFDGCKTRSNNKIQCVKELNCFFAKDKSEECNTILSTATDDNHDHLKEIPYSSLLPGDVVSIIRIDKEKMESTGKIADAVSHAMLVDSVDSDGTVHIIESSGNSINFDKTPLVDGYDSTGTFLNNRILQDILDRETKKAKTQLYGVAIVRFISDDLTYPDEKNNDNINTLSLTPAAKTRIVYPSIDIDKTYTIDSSQTKNQIVSLNDEIEYTIKIKNNSDESYEPITIKEQIPEYTSIGNTITYSVSTENSNVGGAISKDSASKYEKEVDGKRIIEYEVPSLVSHGTYTFSYSVKVNNNSSNIGKYIVSSGTVGNINNRTINLQIGRNLSQVNQENLVNAYNALKDSETTNGLDFIRKIYEEANLTDSSDKLSKLYLNNNPMNASELVTIGDLIDADDNLYPAGDYYNYVIHENAKDMLLYNYYGVRLTKSNTPEENVAAHLIYRSRGWQRFSVAPDYKIRARSFEPANLVTGDILFYNDKVYLYLGNNTIVGRNNNNFEVYNDTTETTSTVLLRNVTVDNYIVLRPSLAPAKTNDMIEEVIENVPNTKLNKSLQTILLFLSGVVMVLIGLMIFSQVKTSKQ